MFTEILHAIYALSYPSFDGRCRSLGTGTVGIGGYTPQEDATSPFLSDFRTSECARHAAMTLRRTPITATLSDMSLKGVWGLAEEITVDPHTI